MAESVVAGAANKETDMEMEKAQTNDKDINGEENAKEQTKTTSGPAETSKAQDEPSSAPKNEPKTNPSPETPTTPTRSKRIRRPAKKFVPTSTPSVSRRSPTSVQQLKDKGTGTPLGEIPNIVFLMNKSPAKSEEMILLHRTIYGNVGTASKRKAEVRLFGGWPDDEEDGAGKNEERSSKSARKAADKLGRVVFAQIKKVAALLDLHVSGTKEEVVNRIINFLQKPGVAEGRTDLAKRAKKKQNARKRKRERTQKGKGKAKRPRMQRKMATDSDVESEEYEDEDEDEDEDEEEVADEEHADQEEEGDVELDEHHEVESDKRGEEDEGVEGKENHAQNKSASQKDEESQGIPSAGDTQETSTPPVTTDKKLLATQEEADSSGTRDETERMPAQQKTSNEKEEDNNRDKATQPKDKQAPIDDSTRDEPDPSQPVNEKSELPVSTLSPEALKQKVVALVKAGNLDDLTQRKIREKLMESLKCSFTKEQKRLIKDTTNETVDSLPAT